MTPEEKSKELYDRFWDKVEDFDLEHENTCIKERKNCAKECAIICCDEMIQVADELKLWNLAAIWEKIKEEIQKL